MAWGLFKKSPNFVPRIKLTHFHPRSYLRQIKLNFLENLIIVKKFYAFLIPIKPRSCIKVILIKDPIFDLTYYIFNVVSEFKIKFHLSSDPRFLTYSTLTIFTLVILI